MNGALAAGYVLLRSMLNLFLMRLTSHVFLLYIYTVNRKIEDLLTFLRV